jgi:hypothetical protein
MRRIPVLFSVVRSGSSLALPLLASVSEHVLVVQRAERLTERDMKIKGERECAVIVTVSAEIGWGGGWEWDQNMTTAKKSVHRHILYYLWEIKFLRSYKAMHTIKHKINFDCTVTY